MAKINPFATAPHSLQEWLLGMYAPGWPSGTSWYVHSGDGTDEAYSAVGSERGLSPGKPFASAAYAIADSAVIASRNTQLILLPGHVETIVGAAGANINKIGIAIRGEGEGRNRPIIDFTTDVAASFDINSASCSIRNCVFRNSIDAQTAMLNVKASDFLMEDCEFQLGDASTQAILGVLTTAAADRMRIRRCHLHGLSTAGVTNAIRIVGGSDAIVEDIYIIAAANQTGGLISVQTTAAVNLWLKSLRLQNLTAGSTKVFVDAITGSTGQISDMRAAILSGTAPVTAATMAWCGNNRYTAALNAADAAF